MIFFFFGSLKYSFTLLLKNSSLKQETKVYTHQRGIVIVLIPPSLFYLIPTFKKLWTRFYPCFFSLCTVYITSESPTSALRATGTADQLGEVKNGSDQQIHSGKASHSRCTQRVPFWAQNWGFCSVSWARIWWYHREESLHLYWPISDKPHEEQQLFPECYKLCCAHNSRRGSTEYLYRK